MEKNRHRHLVRSAIFFITLICLLSNNGCAPTYPKERLAQSVEDVCKKEYNVDVQAKVIGKMIVVFIPLQELFDEKLDILPEAVEKIENVILTTSRVLFSTDAKVDFYMIIAADIKITSAELVLVRYLDDVYKFMHGWIKRDDYRQRVLWRVNFNPKLLQELEFDFEVKEMILPNFLAEQIAQRLNVILESSVVYKLKVKGDYDTEKQQFKFSLIAPVPPRFEKIYVPIILNQAQKIISEYKFNDYAEVAVQNQLLRNKVVIAKEKLIEYRNVNIDNLLTLPAY
ncbi:MAG: hypothetical protein KKH34_01280 [Candidatus Omnitrophica bacterium]|nr:hypothetical protein [Candidatus Omnitrophota bacterium]MCG2702821.1 hypothetical protein [Candidatus Omnitrophota bacterium]